MTNVVGRALLCAALLGLVGCTSAGLGDPCIPERTPPDGFDRSEVYIETSSVQCRTQVCLLYRFEGDPRDAPPETRNNHSFCSCRCAGENDDSGLPLCQCADGFRCLTDTDRGFISTGPTQVRGGYCVPCISEGDDRNLDPSIFSQCPDD